MILQYTNIAIFNVHIYFGFTKTSVKQTIDFSTITTFFK